MVKSDKDKLIFCFEWSIHDKPSYVPSGEGLVETNIPCYVLNTKSYHNTESKKSEAKYVRDN